MKLLEELPGYEKFETYSDYRTYTWHNPRSDNEHDYLFDLEIMYFKHFVILRDSVINIGSPYRDNGSHQEEPVVISRLWFDLVYPLDDSLEKAKRFLLIENDNLLGKSKGDLVDYLYKIPLNGFWTNLKLILNYALSEYNHNFFCEEIKKEVGFKGKNFTLSNYLRNEKYHIDLHHEARSRLFEICFYLNVLHEEININQMVEGILNGKTSKHLILTPSEITKLNEKIQNEQIKRRTRPRPIARSRKDIM